MDSESVHAVVTDPPYGLAFMGRSWDDFDPKEYQQFCEDWARECKRVLKPGGHLLAFSGNRTHHRAFAGVEDAGFEIRDTLTWHYGSGFPKATDVGKTIDKRADAEREVTHTTQQNDIRGDSYNNSDETMEYEHTAPATPEAEKWDGWKTGLKPAGEYIVMARKPFDGATVDCVLEHGTGALNIEGCRVEHSQDVEPNERESISDDGVYGESRVSGTGAPGENGRYPSNVVFDETEAERLDREVGELGSSKGEKPPSFSGEQDHDTNEGWTRPAHEDYESGVAGYEDTGGPSRYFYTSKASKAERTLDGAIDNAHPTVKPADLMEWLVTLVTAEGQTVLDPFAGSGTTLRAAKDKGRRFVGVERQAKWADVARVRVGLTPDDPSVVRGDDAQHGLEAYE